MDPVPIVHTISPLTLPPVMTTASGELLVTRILFEPVDKTPPASVSIPLMVMFPVRVAPPALSRIKLLNPVVLTFWLLVPPRFTAPVLMNVPFRVQLPFTLVVNPLSLYVAEGLIRKSPFMLKSPPAALSPPEPVRVRLAYVFVLSMTCRTVVDPYSTVPTSSNVPKPVTPMVLWVVFSVPPEDTVRLLDAVPLTDPDVPIDSEPDVMRRSPLMESDPLSERVPVMLTVKLK